MSSNSRKRLPENAIHNLEIEIMPLPLAEISRNASVLAVQTTLSLNQFNIDEYKVILYLIYSNVEPSSLITKPKETCARDYRRVLQKLTINLG